MWAEKWYVSDWGVHLLLKISAAVYQETFIYLSFICQVIGPEGMRVYKYILLPSTTRSFSHLFFFCLSSSLISSRKFFFLHFLLLRAVTYLNETKSWTINLWRGSWASVKLYVDRIRKLLLKALSLPLAFNHPLSFLPLVIIPQYSYA